MICESAALDTPINLENSAVATGLERMFKHTIVLISHTSKIMLKILKARLQQYMN